MARTVMDQIIAYGGVRRGLLGVSIATVTPEIAESYDLADTSGALVTAVNSDSAAEAAGLEIGDVITSINGEPVDDPGALRNAIGLLRPEDTVTVSYFREGRAQTTTATLGEATAAGGPELGPERLAEIDPAFEGAEFATNDENRPNFNGVEGMLATQVESGSAAYLRGLRTGDVITHVNRQRVRTVEMAREIITDARSVILQVSRNNRGVLILMR